MNRVAIVGLGLIGGSLGLALRQARPKLEILGIARQEKEAATAVKLGAVTAGGVDLQLALSADLVVIATPLQEMRLVLAQLGPLITGTGILVTDVGSTKAAVCGWAAELLGGGRHFLGGHPMTGKTETGLKAADRDLFKGSPWIFTPSQSQDLEPFSGWMELVEALGAKPVLMSPEEHDRRVALVSHLAFVASAAYVAAVKASPDWADAVRIAGPGFRDVTRLAGGDPDLYTEIARTNRDNLLAAVQRLEAELAKFRRHLEADDPRIWELFEETKRVHDQWTR